MSPYHHCDAHAQNDRWIDGSNSYNWRLISGFFSTTTLCWWTFHAYFTITTHLKTENFPHGALRIMKYDLHVKSFYWIDGLVSIWIQCNQVDSGIPNANIFDRWLFLLLEIHRPVGNEWEQVSGHGENAVRFQINGSRMGRIFSWDPLNECLSKANDCLLWSKLPLLLNFSDKFIWPNINIIHCFRMDAKIWQNALQLIFYGLLAPVNGAQRILSSLERYDSNPKVNEHIKLH